ncbi:ATP-binding protein [Winogradskyella sp. A3E31]|uniref:ATP-binding protein n=1 Tax=Winogradskyella sp. A3E31 TaxID=3349637 RepID=UPI00398AE8BD
MKLTKKIESDIWNVYDTWLHSYLNGDVKTYESFLCKDYHFIGSTDNEEFLNKKDTTDFFKATADQLAGKCDLRNENKIIEEFEGLVIVTHLFDAWFKNGDDYTYYGRFRFTNALKETKKGWRFVYQHFSTTDSKTDEGETIGFDKVNAENLELKEAIKRRTKELEEKNRELEVETALERIRAQAVAMKASSDLLDIVVTMRNEFINLGHEAHYFWHMMWLPETYEKAMTSGDGSKIGFVMELPRHMHGDIPQLAKWEKSKKPTVVYAMDVDEAIDYVDKMVALGNFKNIDPQAPTHDDIKHIGGLTFIMARTSHGEIGYSLPGVVKKPPKSDIDILVKFAGAFDLAHQRFLDLQKAEKQARETQIELALEKVRSRTMAMQHSDELQEASFLLDQQVRALGIKTWGCAFNIYGEKESTEWFGNEAGVLHTYTVPREGIFKEYYDKGQKGETLFIQEFSGNDCVTHYEYMSSLPVIGDVLKTLKETNNGFPTYQIDHVVYFKYGYLLFITREHVPDSYDIFKRFAKVFEQTYTRFLDLQKAEKQARESEIELALERVRARTMAMQHSDELAKTAALLFKQINDLGIETWTSGFNIWEENDTSFIGYNPTPSGDITAPYRIPSTDDPFFKKIHKAKKSGKDFMVFEASGKSLAQTYKYMKTLPVVKDVLKGIEESGTQLPKSQINHCAFFTHGFLLFITLESYPEAHDIFKRFAKVFEQTYTRFLDLQKAEAQAREAQIEAALERVRSRSMAMHKSEEIGDVAFVLFEQLKSLGGELWGTGFGFCEKDSDVDEFWFANEKGIMPQLKIPNTVDPTHKQMYQGWKKDLEIVSIEKGGKALKDHYKYMLTVTDVQPIFQGMLDNGMAFPKWQKWHAAYFKYGYLLVITTEPYKNEAIFKRFAKVFEQAYTRFLDLKKAEAQAREAQIEAALEKVRSRSLAVHKSEEFKEVISIVFEKLKELQIPATAVGIGIKINGSKDLDAYVCGENEEGLVITNYRLPYFNNKISKDICNAFDNEADVFVGHYTKTVKNNFYKYVLDKTSEFKDLPEDILSMIFNSTSYSITMVTSEYVVFNVNDFEGKSLTEHEIDIVKRFSRVFNQAYIRFLDLQKSEAQAREAQIEAALERVRSRTMAMQKSDELLEAGALLYKELNKLGINNLTTGYVLFNEDSKIGYSYGVNPADGSIRQHPVEMPHDKTSIMKSIVKSWKNEDSSLVIELNEEETIKHQTFIAERSKNFPISAEQLLAISPDRLKIHIFNFKQGYLLIVGDKVLKKAEQNLVIRFAKAFQQTYTRFLDLQKAEAQARESKIEAALERVRSRSMAMHHTSELQDVINTVHQQFTQLDIEISGGVFIGINEDIQDTLKCWGSGGTADYIQQIEIPYMDVPIYTEIIEGIQKGPGFFTEQFTQDEKIDFLTRLFEIPPFNSTTKTHQKEVLSRKGGYTRSCAVSENSCIFIISHHGHIFSNETNTILKRFAKVFEQAYTRFLDLQKAEVQTREAKIETALEKVRSRSMAMHHSDELWEVAELLFEQINSLGIELWSCGFSIWYDDDSYFMGYNPGPDGKLGTPMPIPLTEDVFFTTIRDAKRQGEDFIVFESKGKSLEQTYRYMDKLPIVGDVMRGFVEAGFDLPKFQVTHCGFFSYGHLMFITLDHNPEAIHIFKRFTKAFDQTYTRFLDLQKAEAQTRTAQINLAVERVRAKALAMHKSEEILEVVTKLKDEVMGLDIPDVVAASIFLSEGDDKVRMWDLSSLEDEDNYSEVPFDVTFKLKKTDPHFYIKRVWENQENYFVEIQDEKGFKRLMKWLRDMEKNEIADEVEDFIEKTQLKRLYHTVKKLNNGKLAIDLLNPPSEEMETILTKMGAAFDLAYKRFEDLQKAEHQAREAQIEASLERLRAATMAMHKTEDISDVVLVYFDQLKTLKIEFIQAWITIFYLEEEAVDVWFSPLKGIHNETKYFKMPSALFKDTSVKSWKNGEPFSYITFPTKSDVDNFMQVCDEVTNSNYFGKIQDKLKLEHFEMLDANHKYGCISKSNTTKATNEEKDILQRFTKVFEQTYTRFLDLQKSEAQAREAQIEVAMERIRSRALAMRDSNEIMDVITEIRRQIDSLGQLDLEASVVHLYQEGDSTFESIAAVRPPGESGEIVLARVLFPVDATDQIKHMMKKYNSQESEYTIEFDKKMAEDWQQVMLKHAPTIAERRVGFVNNRRLSEHSEYWNFSDFSDGSLLLVTHSPASTDTKIVLNKASQVFDLAYKRFKDLQKAEAQTREAQIEAALERVRSRSMAMHKSTEMQEVANAVYEQMKSLGLEIHVIGMSGEIKPATPYEVWVGGSTFTEPLLIPYTDSTKIQRQYNKAIAERPELYQGTFSGEVKKEYIDFLISETDIPKPLKKLMQESPAKTTSISFSKNSSIQIVRYTEVPYSKEDNSILIRFAKVFNQAYIRFLDLQKSEAQTREAQIEAALEKVRSRTMAMQTSSELPEAANTLFLEVQALGIPAWSAGYCIWEDDSKKSAWCNMSSEGEIQKGFSLPTIGEGYDFYNPLKTDEPFYIHELGGKELVKHYEFMTELPIVGDIFKDFDSKGIALPTFQIFHIVYFEYGYVMFITYEAVAKAHDIFKRFGKVFEQTYTRFLDLKKAEAQAREAQIEAALERVRSQSMGMQSTDDFGAVTTEMFNQLRNFGEDLFATGIVFCDKHEGHVEQWHSIPGAGMVTPFIVPIDLDYIHQYRYDQWKKGAELFSIEIPGDFIEQHFKDIFDLPSAQIALKDLESRDAPMPEAPPWEIDYGASFEHGYVLISSLKPLENTDILLRFTKVFEQAYTRFLDLKRAEAQAREAQIEASLERVRAKAMSMQNSEELDEVLSVLCEQFDILDIVPMSTHMTVLDLENNTFTFRETGKFGNRSFGEQTVALDAMDNWKETVDKWKADKASSINKLHFPKEQLPEVWNVFHESFASMPKSSRITQEDYPDGIYHTAGKHPFGYIGMNQIRPATEEEEQIVIKFANEFGRAYQRFLDLQKAEKQARDAQIEAALEKVRSRSLSMQQPNELNEVVQLIAEKLQELDVILDLGGVVICTYFPDSKDVLHWIATPDSESSGKFLLPYFDHVILKEAWASKNKGDQWFSKAYSIEEKNSFFEHAFEHSDYKHFPDEAKKDILNRKHHTLSFAWSKYSALLIPSYSGLMPSENEKDILIRFAKVFEHAYIRFMDLQEKEVQSKALFEEKKRLEKTLSDLQTTQKQLIQSEKMASLGELTAGIAHEIQNPLNFVNNFSEVSKELLEEMAEEIENGDFEEVKAIMDDVIQNLEKINHHGQRADGIVKGMLQHSRASGDKKEPTDINKLADEYMRLAYHGLRAKNKQFNATLETNFDESLPKAPIIPQDIGRVILNLFTNAFYAVDEKKSSFAKASEDNYEPTVSVTTKQKKGDIEITVSDNANGIPEHIKDKIFQPFFTTKPTGQGTGLGLSMSYDIITKGHGGDISIQTKENKGTSFIIKLPIM